MSSPRFTRLEVWSNLQCASGTRLAVIPDLLAAEDYRAVSGEDALTIRLPVGSASYQHLAARRVLRTVFADDSWQEWRILSLTTEQLRSGELVGRVEGGDPLVVLGDVVVSRTEQDGSHTWQIPMEARTAAEHLSQVILPALTAEGYSWVAAGTIDPTEPIPLVYDYTTALAALRYLAEALGVELRIRRNGTSQYLVDLLTRIGSTAAVRYVHAGRDLLQFLREIDAAPMATRVIPRGADEGGIRATMAEAEWRVASVLSGTELTLEDPLGGDGPIGEDTQFDGLYLEQANGTRSLIASTLESTQKVVIPSTAGMSVGDLVKFRKSSTGEVLDYLESPAQKTVAGYGLASKVLDLPDLPGTVNRAPNPACRLYTTGSNAPPDNWEIAPGSGLAASAVDKEAGTTYWTVGGASARVAATADGQGVGPEYATIAPSAKRPFLSAFMKYRNETDGSKVRVEVLLGIAAVSVSSMTRATSGGITTVTVNTSGTHGRAVNETVEVAGAVGGTTADGYNGVQRITKVVDSDTFEFQLAADPGTISGTITVRRVWHYKTSGWAVAREWVELGIGGNAIDANAAGATVAKVRVVQDGSTASTFYADAAQITLGSGEGQRPFIEGAGPTRLWQAANLHRRDYAPPATRYELQLVDLARLDGTVWAYEDLVLGQTIVAVHPDLPGSPISTRLVDLRRNLLVDGVATVGLSTRPTDITDALVRPVRSDRWSPTLAPPRRQQITLRIPAVRFVPKNASDASHLFIGAISTVNTLSTDATGGTAYAGLGELERFRGARILGLEADLNLIVGGVPKTASATLKLLKDTATVATLTADNVSATQILATLTELIGSETWRLEFEGSGASGSSIPQLSWVDLLLEVEI